MKGEIISIGTELLLGHITDSNASWLARQLAALGINCYHISEVGDNLERVTLEIKEALARSDFVITTGGMGPTEDDVTREALAIVFGEELEIQKEAELDLRNFFKNRNYEMPLNNLKQVKLIKSGRFLKNSLGTAPGIWAEKNNKIVVCLPGVPSEMKNIWQNQVLSNLQPRQIGRIILTKTYKIVGILESVVEERIKKLLSSSNPTVATYAKSDGIHVRTSAMANSKEEAVLILDSIQKEIEAIFGNSIYGIDDITMSEVVLEMLQKNNLTLAVAEEFTAGFVCSMLNYGSANFAGGLVEKLPDIITTDIDEREKPAIDRSRQLAINSMKHFNSDLGLGIAVDNVRTKDQSIIYNRFSSAILVNRNGEVLSNNLRLDSSDFTVTRNRIVLNALNMIREYFMAKS